MEITMKRHSKSEIKKEAKEFLKQGKSRQETFELLIEKHKYITDVADVLKQLPSAKAIEKYGKWNNVLLGIMLATALFYLILIGVGAWLIWYGVLIYVVVKRRFENYFWVSILAFIIFVAVLIIWIRNFNESLDYLAIALILGLHMPMIYLPFWLEKKLCPKPKQHRELYTNPEGRDKIKIMYEFSDL
jgi:hypothetical protein